MKNQALFSSKDKSKKIKMPSAAIFVWRFMVKLSEFALSHILDLHIHLRRVQNDLAKKHCFSKCCIFCEY